MREIIDNFYETRIKEQEDTLYYGLRKGISKYFFYTLAYMVVIFIICFVIFNLYDSPIGFFIVPFLIIIGVIYTGFLIYAYRKLYLKTSNKISIKERILNRLNLEENNGIDKPNVRAAGGLYFVSIFIAVILYLYSFSSPNPSLMVIISSVIMFIIIFLIYRAFLVHKTELTKDFFIIKKPIIFHKTFLKWNNIDSVKTTLKYHQVIEGGTSYTTHKLIINTTLHEKPLKIYLGRKRSSAAMKVLEEFLMYMIEL
ncbi:MAG: hypothetical protein V3V33_10815 [Candidatus Lokiarchaeia archaeon]